MQNMSAINSVYQQANGITGSSEKTGPYVPFTKSIEEFAKVFDKAEVAVNDYALERIDSQAVVQALTQAELALQAATTVRDRLVTAYQELLRMPI